MNKENYPEVISHEDNLVFEILENFDGGSYADDYKKACDYVKKNGGVVYTVCDDEGSKVYYSKGSQWCDRLGYVVIKIKELKE